MFTSLSSLLFGDTEAEVREAAGDSKTVDIGLMTSTLPHSDWELVDKIKDDDSGSVGSDAENKADVQVNKLSRTSSISPSFVKIESNYTDEINICEIERVKFTFAESNHKVSLMESWFMTPPSCFTASMPGVTGEVLVSPLENALIEHPSMSVYHPNKLKKQKKDRCDFKKKKNVKPRKSSSVDTPHRVCVISSRAAVLKDINGHYEERKVSQDILSGRLTKKSCEKTNKCVKVAKRGSQYNRNNRPCGSMAKRAC